MTSSILFVGGEDIDFSQINGTVWAPTSFANTFRSGYARQAMTFVTGSNTVDTTHYLRGSFASTTSFWSTYRYNYVDGGGTPGGSQSIPCRFVDSTGVVRLRIRFTATFSGPNDTFVVEKINAAGTITQIGSTSTGRYCSNVVNSGTPTVPDKIDVFINYAVSGTFAVYLNGTQTFTFSGDVTTDSTTTLAGLDMGVAFQTNNSGNQNYFSEAIVATRDTRNFSLVTQAPTANGNTHNWDGGTAANAAAAAMATAQLAPQFSGTAGQIQEYQVTPAIPTGNQSVISVVQKAQATVGSTGPSKFDFMVRTASTDYTSTPDTVPTTAWGTFSNNWDTNPNTSAPWATSDLPASSTSFNMGLKSVT